MMPNRKGFTPGGISLQTSMLPGPIREAFDHASHSELKPVKLTGTHGPFMFETRYAQRFTTHAAKSSTLQR